MALPHARIPKTFATPRLVALDSVEALGIRAQRQLLLRSLPTLLAPAVLEHLPSSMVLTQNPDAWFTRQGQDAKIYCVKAQANYIGLILLYPEPGHPQSLRLGYLLGQEHWGKGYAHEMLVGLIDVLKANGVTALLAGTAKDNLASRKLLEKIGFQETETSANGVQFVLRL